MLLLPPYLVLFAALAEPALEAPAQLIYRVRRDDRQPKGSIPLVGTAENRLELLDLPSSAGVPEGSRAFSLGSREGGLRAATRMQAPRRVPVAGSRVKLLHRLRELVITATRHQPV